jgi:hypothetical protein
MIVTLKDRTAIIATKDEADKIKNAIEDGAVGIELGNRWFRADWVATIMPGGNVEKINDKQIEAPDNRGKNSPAKEKLRKDLEKLRNKVTV